MEGRGECSCQGEPLGGHFLSGHDLDRGQKAIEQQRRPDRRWMAPVGAETRHWRGSVARRKGAIRGRG